MKLQLSSDNMSITPSMHTLVENKIQKLNRLLSDIDSDAVMLRVVLNSAPDDKFLVKLDLSLKGNTFYTEEMGFELETTLVDAIEELIRQYKREKSKETNKWSEEREDKYLNESDLDLPSEDETTLEQYEEELDE